MISSPGTNNREPQFAGQFYPKDENDLKHELTTLFSEAKTEFDDISNPSDRLRALISPHAGYVFSGKVAASAFQQIPENARYKRVFVLASSHRFSFNGAAVFSGNYKTPLGEINTDVELLDQLKQQSPLFIQHNEAHFHEHSLEVQLPFLQHKLGINFLLVPLILGTQSPETCKEIARVLKHWFTPENLFVISTDFSHYPGYNDAKQVDFLTATAICTNQTKKLLNVIKENKQNKIDNLATSLCGWTSVLTLLHLTKKEDFRYREIAYQNSGDSKIHGEKNRVVGYWAIGIFDERETFQINEAEKTELLEKARSAIKEFVKTGRRGKLSPPQSNGILNKIAGVFVSIYIEKELRGCIGSFARDKTLNDLVQKMAVSASHDKRFEAIKADELDKITLEISVLSPRKEIKTSDEIELGKHGILIRRGSDSGTLLPQVAVKMGWSTEQFLGHCARDKAGIGWNGWKTAQIFTYEAIVFRG